MQYQKILLTGGGGFIGRRVCKMLLDSYHDVIVLDNFRFSDKKATAGLEKAEWVYGDTTNTQLVHELVKRVDAVIHLAAPSSFLMYEEDPIPATVGTVHGFLNILEAMRKLGKKKVVYASTSAVYEGLDFPWTEDLHICPPDLKATSKKVCEEFAKIYNDRFGITCIGMRPFSVYGVGEHTKGGYANVTSLFAWAMLQGKTPVVWGDGLQTRDYIFVDDVARAFIMALKSDIPTDVFNLGTGIETNFNEVIDIVNEQLGTSLRPEYVPVPITIYAPRLKADTRHIEDKLNFKPEIDVREGIRRIIANTRQLLEQEKLGKAQMYYESLKDLE